MNEFTLLDMFLSHTGRQIDKWIHYFDIYEKHFERFKRKPVRVLELGIDHGGSLQLWKRYFGSQAEIIGIDSNPATMFSEAQISTYCHDQRSLDIAKFGPFDIVIDDGSHFVQHQTISFDNLWPHTTGVYLIEDCQSWQVMPDSNIAVNVGDAFPTVRHIGGLEYKYPWVAVYERPTRLIRGTPSRETRPDEDAARRECGP
jgi:cephalosporin hydroxylase